MTCSNCSCSSQCPPRPVCPVASPLPGATGCRIINPQPDANGCITSCPRMECTGNCGNGIIEAGEQCDDENRISRDGCSSSCNIEFGSSCDARNYRLSTNVLPLNNPQYEGISRPNLTMFNGQLWIVGGGTGPSGDKRATNVISTTDGIRWTHRGNVPGAIVFSSAVEYQNKIWLFGTKSFGSRGNYSFYSSDGITWHSGPALPTNLKYPKAVVFNNKIWLYVSDPQRRIYSFDGTNLLDNGALSSGVDITKMIAYNGYLWSFSLKTYKSSDGIHWVVHSEQNPRIRYVFPVGNDVWSLKVGADNTLVLAYEKNQGSPWEWIEACSGKIQLPVAGGENVIGYNGKILVIGGLSEFARSALNEIRSIDAVKFPSPAAAFLPEQSKRRFWASLFEWFGGLLDY